MPRSSIRITLAAATIVAALVVGGTSNAQQPTSVNPTENAVNEQQLLRQSNEVQGRISIPDQRESMLIHPAGRDWREFHEVTLRWIGAGAIIGMLVLLVAFYLWRGMIRIDSGRSGRLVERFNAFERFVHWMTAVSFIVLGLTGLNITFGKPLLLPLIGPEAFTTWSQWAKYAHNSMSFPFTLGVVIIFLMWIAGNIPNRVDLEWLKRGGGMVGHDHPPAYRFNAGQKAIYWVVVLASAAAISSGYMLMFPFYGTGIDTMQDAEIAHGIMAMLFIAVILAHIYIGTIGMEGAFEGMGSGTVDLNWAREHHRLWLEEEEARIGPNDRRPQPSVTPAE